MNWALVMVWGAVVAAAVALGVHWEGQKNPPAPAPAYPLPAQPPGRLPLLWRRFPARPGGIFRADSGDAGPVQAGRQGGWPFQVI
ncbi:hypothetical protein [Pararhodospirillum photometricum]|uniref:hypothetical protein n=1 Tax=Pararhodospirillum photometricum TaxID=1084 RepID=UPI0002D6B439|nr:hypothetical protein [Pararhodospirillum photometricum]